MAKQTLTVEQIARSLCKSCGHNPDRVILGLPYWESWRKPATDLLESFETQKEWDDCKALCDQILERHTGGGDCDER